MGISLSLDAKSKISLSNESKDTGLTWDEATATWDEYDASTWGLPKLVLTKETKTKISLNNEAK